MEPAFWNQLSDIVADALDLPAAERDAFLDGACAGNAALRAEAAALVEAHLSAESEAAFETPIAHPRLARVGPWRISDVLGEGGMGIVYAAERADGAYRRAAALKLVRAGASRDFADRFLRERQLLAGLDHPGVARLLDGGVADDGRPYLAMEIVEGEPITAYAERHALGVEARIRLFLQVCEAVAYAHRRLVVHRDLKPGHVLVVEDVPGVPAVKLLDFGIAKLLGDDGDVLETSRGILTPAYAAPEQFQGQPITTATDVYSLGVVLYELLAGRRPYELAGRSAGEAERVVTGEAPPPPSTVAEAPPRRRALRGDLDTVVLKALAKEPERRYESAAALADDLRRHLDGLPVAARPDTLRYRAGRFARRHRVGVAASLLLLLSVVAGLSATLVQAGHARAEAARAEGINTFLLGMLAAPTPYADGRDVRVATLLDSAAAQAAQNFAGQPAVEAAIRQTLGVSYFQLGLYDESEGQLRQAVALREGLYGPDHPDVSASQSALGQTLQKMGRYDDAEPLLRAALAADSAHFPAGDPRVGKSMTNLGVLLWEMGRYDSARPLLEQALALDEKAYGPDHEEVAVDLGNLATLLADEDSSEAAEPLYRRQLAILVARHGRAHPEVANALTQLGILRHDLGDLAEADTLYTQALALYRQLYGPSHSQVAYGLSNLATLRTDQDSLEGAAALLEQGIVMLKETMGAAHPNVGIQINNLAAVRRRQGDLAGAEKGYAEAVAVWRAGLPPDHPYLAYGLHNLGAVRSARGNDRGAVAPLREALAIRQKALPPGHTETAVTASILGSVLGHLAPSGEALRLLEESAATLRENLGASHLIVQQSDERLAEYRARWGRQ